MTAEARVHNHAFENFLMAGVEAYASQILEEVDPPLSWKAYTAACEDYQFARRRFEEKGMELPSFYEHSYNSSLSQYWATASWAASQIYSCQLKGLSFMDAEASMDKTYAVYAADYAGRMLACQEPGIRTALPVAFSIVSRTINRLFISITNPENRSICRLWKLFV